MKGRRRVPDQKPTIRDIARRAGVSVASVSRALNDYPDINPETKAHILRIAEELRYWPSATAKNLATARTMTVGVYLDLDSKDAFGLRHPFVNHVLTVFARTVGEAGYDVLWFVNRRAPYDGWSLLDRVRHRMVDGLFLVGPPKTGLEELVAGDVPLLAMDFHATGARVGTVISDNRQGMRDLVDVLVQLGYTRLAHLYGPLNGLPAMERLQGFYSGCEAHGLDVPREWVQFGGFSRESGYLGAKALLDLPERPEVILAASDAAAFGVLDAVYERGWSVPDEIAVTGFDDIEEARYAYPPLTTVAQDKDAMGRIAGETLVDMMQQREPGRPHHYVLPVRVVVRASTRPGTAAGVAGPAEDRAGPGEER
jgi:LacI family transcriptional regulator